jgi:hypothetical protein
MMMLIAHHISHANKMKKSSSKTTSKSKFKPSSNDPITSIFEKVALKYSSEIPKAIHAQLITKSQETLRLLSSKTTPGQQICKGDSPESRSVVVLEHILRRGISLKDGSTSPSVRVPLAEMARFVAVRKDNMERIANAISLHLNGINLVAGNQIKKSNATISTHRGKRKLQNNLTLSRGQKYRSMDSSRQSSSSSNHIKSSMILENKSISVHKRNAVELMRSKVNRKNSSTSSNKNLKKTRREQTSSSTMHKTHHNDNQLPHSLGEVKSSSECISLLSIKLQSFLHDPDNIEKKSKALWMNIVHFKLQEKSTRIIVLRDLKSNAKAYNGACFYYTVQDLELGNTSTSTSSSSSNTCNGKKARKTNSKLQSKERNQKVESVVQNKEDFAEENDVTIEDIISELRIEEQSFAKILQDVSKCAAKLGKQKYCGHESQSTNVSKSSRKNNSDSTVVNTKRCFDGVISSTASNDLLINGGDEYDDINNFANNVIIKYIAKKELLQWKSEVLTKTYEGSTKYDELSVNGLTKSQQIHTLRLRAELIAQRFNDT